jgi:hypothetical protein
VTLPDSRYERRPEHDLALLDLAWGIIANAARFVEDAGPGWVLERGQWLEGAGKWRTAWFERMAETSGPPRGAVVEILERLRPGVDPDEPPALIVPDEVRVNGVPLLVSVDGPVVERIDCGEHREPGVVRVTLTLFARRVLIDAVPAEVPAL